MKMLLYVLAIISATGVTSWAQSRLPSRQECSVEETTSAIQFTTIERMAELARQQQALLPSLEAINNKAKDAKRPLGEQISTKDAAEFGKLSQRLLMLRMLDAIESSYGRDARVIRMMFSIADKAYAGSTELPKERTEEYQAATILFVLRKVRAENKWNEIAPPNVAECTVELALHRVEQVRDQKIGSLGIESAQQTINEIKARTGTLDRDKLSSRDRAAVERIVRDVFNPARREVDFANDLENLKGLWKAALLRYEMNKKDVIDSAGDGKAVGRSLDAMPHADTERVYLNALDRISELIPSDSMKMMKQMDDAMRRAGIHP